MTAFFDDPIALFDDPSYTFDGEVTGSAELVANAGVDQAITLPTEVATLDGSATDDGIPVDPDEVTYLWELLSGPGPVLFLDASDPETDAHFPSPGTYTLRLTVTHDDETDTDTMLVVVSADTPETAGEFDWELDAVGADPGDLLVGAIDGPTTDNFDRIT